MESIAIVLDCEEEFGICIPDAVAEKMLTPRQLIDFVSEERRRTQQMGAMTQLRKVLASIGFLDVRPETSFNQLFGRQRVEQWKKLRLQLAPFSAPSAIDHGPGRAMAGLALLLGLGSLFFSQWMSAAVCAVAFVVGWLWKNSARRIPDPVGTMEKLAAHLTRPISESEIAERVKSIVVDQLGLKEGVYGENKRFIEDLGMP